MTATTATKKPDKAAAVRPSGARRGGGHRPNWLGGAFGWIWLLIVMVPIYWIVITSFKTQANYYATNPLQPPGSPTIDNYQLVIENDFIQYFINSVIVTAGAILPAVVISFMAAFAIVRGNLMGPACVIAVILVLVGLALALALRRIGGKDPNASQLEGA